MVSLASQMVSDASSNLQIGTIDFQEEIQLLLIFEGKKAIQDGADDLDYVCNYEAFKMAI
jgi:deoxyribose-phosphate aldolase